MRRLPIVLFVASLIGSPARAQPHEQSVQEPPLIAQRTAQFAGDLRKFLGVAADVGNCTHMVQQAVGVRGGNISYGAICAVRIGKQTRQLLLCDDEMFGHFALAASFVFSDDYVASFVRNNCYGG